MKIIEKFLGKKLKIEEKAFAKVKVKEIMLAMCFIIAGIVLFINENFSEKTIANILGILILLEGIINIRSTIMKESNSLFGPNLLFGIMYIIISIFFFTNIIKLLNYVQIYYGIYLAISGLRQFVLSIKLKGIQEPSFLITFIMAILNVAIGCLLVFYNFQGFTTSELIAIFSILFGILSASNSNLLKNRTKKIISKVDSD